jgi:hypothetical protein
MKSMDPYPTGLDVDVDVPLKYLRVIIITNSRPSDDALLSRLAAFHMSTVNPQIKANLAIEAITASAQQDIDELAIRVNAANTARQPAHNAIRAIVSRDTSPRVRDSQNTARQVYAFTSNKVKDNQTPIDDEIDQFITEITNAAAKSRRPAEEQMQDRFAFGIPEEDGDLR